MPARKVLSHSTALMLTVYICLQVTNINKVQKTNLIKIVSPIYLSCWMRMKRKKLNHKKKLTENIKNLRPLKHKTQ